MSKWIGYAVSVNCGDPLGCYQGTIMEADGSTITLTKAFRNGFPYPKSKVTLNSADIKELKIIESKAEPAEQTHSTVAVTKNNKKNRATVCENLQANPTSTGHQTDAGAVAGSKAGGAARSKPIDIQGARPAAPSKHAAHTGSYGGAGSTPKSRGGGQAAARRRNEACFGDAADPALDDDFDFEGNLALFDKRALWERMRATRPDLVRGADDAVNFRHDENVLGGGGGGGGSGGGGERAALRVPAGERAARDYVTDEGARLEGAAPRLRRALWAGLRRRGLGSFAGALLARAAADVALRLVGGGRRLEARNAHQAPCCVALCGAHAAGAAGLAAARVLASHGVRCAALRPPGGTSCAALARELAAAAQADVALVEEAGALPSPDVVLLALYDPELDDPQEQYEGALAWARAARAALVAVEPPARGWPGLAARASLVALVPPALPDALGRVYLADVAPPARLFSELGVWYRPPFGAASLLPLHPADD